MSSDVASSSRRRLLLLAARYAHPDQQVLNLREASRHEEGHGDVLGRHQAVVALLHFREMAPGMGEVSAGQARHVRRAQDQRHQSQPRGCKAGRRRRAARGLARPELP